MEGDFALDPLAEHGFSRILMQQGRVLLPSDWNEQVAVMTEQFRLLARDLIGPHGGPDDGFKIKPGDGTDADKLRILRGRYWVDGIPVQHDGDLFLAKPTGPTVLYLDVYEIHVSAAQDPAILEVALAGADTTSRAKVIWQVRTTGWNPSPMPKAKDLADAAREAFPGLIAGIRGQLTAVAHHDDDDNDACIVSPDAHYRGVENQLYRVEIHAVPEAGTVIFKWSRDNGSIVFPVEEVAGRTARLRSLGRDARTALSPHDYVEVVDDSIVYDGPRHDLLAIQKVMRDSMTVEFDSPLPKAEDHAILRRWDSKLLTVPQGGGAVALESGISVSFSDPKKTSYRPGDYWLIPARTATGDVIWPRTAGGDPIPREPDGPRHHYAPIAYAVSGSNVVDLRFAFKAATLA